ncbi:MAG: hypothetical protein AMXMBFR13_02460 [Phycisphaerae bacterium]|jgi:hypothetical protein
MRKTVAGLVAVTTILALAGYAWSNNRTTDPIGVAVSPQTLVLSKDQGGAVTVHTAIPLSQVDPVGLALSGVPADAVWADDRGNLVCRFSETAIEAIVSPPRAVLTLVGNRIDGSVFSGSDSVRVIR